VSEKKFLKLSKNLKQTPIFLRRIQYCLSPALTTDRKMMAELDTSRGVSRAAEPPPPLTFSENLSRRRR
jgi:hypothetical protein